MPFLWKHKMQLSIDSERPSPKHRMQTAENSGSIERASLRASLRRRILASMTVEAAIVLPLFLFFFVNLGSAIEMIRLHGNLELAIWNTGNKVCLYGYAADSALSYTYIKSEVADYAGESYLEESPLTHGVSGLQFWESSLPAPDDTVDILMTYQVSPWLDIPAFPSFRMQNRYYGHMWTGYGIPDNLEDPDEDVVYITEYASVYHESLQCTHLKLTIREVTLEEAKSSRNASGKKYQMCSKCRGAPFTGTVFIAKEGDCYHYIRGCPGLKRTIYTVPRRQAASKYRPCSRCGGG